jgi:hypothetical protein
MFSRWIVTNITSARGTVHSRKTRIPCGINSLSVDCMFIEAGFVVSCKVVLCNGHYLYIVI